MVVWPKLDQLDCLLHLCIAIMFQTVAHMFISRWVVVSCDATLDIDIIDNNMDNMLVLGLLLSIFDILYAI